MIGIFINFKREYIDMLNTGTVKFFNEDKGFGFITPNEGGKDLFVHKNGIKRGPLTEGVKIQFETESTPKGLSAINVEVIDEE